MLLLPFAVAASGPLNVLFITVDDMNWDSVGAFGSPVADITPNLDRLAESGMRFNRAHVTIAICRPTRAVWMTGRYPHRSGALGFDPINPDVPTLLEALKKAGYLTGILAKVSHVIPSRRKVWDVIVPANKLKVGRDPQLFYRYTKEFLDRAKQSGQPFFLMANAQDPHRPFPGSAQEEDARKRAQRKGGKWRRNADFPAVTRTYQPDEITVPAFLPDLPEVRKELAGYFTSVHRADEVVGAVIRALDESGLGKRTLVMFMSDHGMPFPFAKTNVWLNSTKTPWIVRWPGVVQPGGVDDEHFIAGIDFAPTILDALGLPQLAESDGASFVPVLKGGKQANRTHVFTYINRTAARREYPMRSVVTARFGYIYNGWSDGKTVFVNESQSGVTMAAMLRAARTNPVIASRVRHFLYRTPEEFYDYAADPAARKNLVNDRGYRFEIDRMRRLLRRHMEQTTDPELDNFNKRVFPR